MEYVHSSKLRRNKLYLAYHLNQIEKITFFKYLDKDRNTSLARIKRYGGLDQHNSVPYALFESYSIMHDYLAVTHYEFFELSFDEFAYHVVTEII